ncbi:MAG: phosphatidylserine decarboxylase [Methanomassiliicoccales archaeon]|nr:MAG: phosphatidylserine decarboxylase [Methanomassiliicoccales archaeon]
MRYPMLAKGSIPLIAIPLVLAQIIFLLRLWYLSFVFLGIGILFIIFFRDPEREISSGIVAPADGVVTGIFRGEETIKIITVMGLADVHVNRAPLGGKVVNITHIPGQHKLAKSKDSEANERLETTLETDMGQVMVTQIAGAFARRIVSYTREGENLSKGQRMGIIRFGSRVDLVLPNRGYEVLVEKGSRVKAGASSLATEVGNEE